MKNLAKDEISICVKGQTKSASIWKKNSKWEKTSKDREGRNVGGTCTGLEKPTGGGEYNLGEDKRITL